jgi:hypothetical protein
MPIGEPPLIQGQTYPSWTFKLQKKDGSYPDITGATFTGTIHRLSSTAKKVTMTIGNFSLTDPENGEFVYVPADADVAETGTFQAEMVVVVATRKLKVKSKPYTIEPALGAV